MTVSAQTPLNRSTGNGVTTVFPYTFKVLAEEDIEVSVDGVVKTLTTDYTLSGIGTDGGNVTMVVAPAVDAVVVRRRNMAYTRSVDYQNQGELPADTLDDDQDAPILMIQQLGERQERSMTFPVEVSGVSTELPTPAPLQFLRWNALANALESVLLADVSLISLTAYAQTFLQAVDAAAARAVLGATTVGHAIFTAANAAAARTALAFTTVGNALAIAVDEADARAAIAAAASGANSDITSLTALTAGGLPNNSVLTNDIADAQITPAKLNGGQSGSAPIYGCRAWVKFNGSGTVAVQASGNVSSVTDLGVGYYQVNFTTAMQDANYCAVGSCTDVSAGSISALRGVGFLAGSQSTSSINLATVFWVDTGAESADVQSVYVAIFR